MAIGVPANPIIGKSFLACPAFAAGRRYTADEYVVKWRSGGPWDTSGSDFYRIAREQVREALVNSG